MFKIKNNYAKNKGTHSYEELAIDIILLLNEENFN